MTTRIESLLKACTEIMTEWEVSFCHSLIHQLEKGRTLSEKQMTVYQKIEGKLQSDLRGHAGWKSSWDALKAKRWKMALTYYEGEGTYFQQLVRRSKVDPEWIPTESEYKKLTENKFASRVIQELEKDPVFQPGQCVQLRSNAGIESLRREDFRTSGYTHESLRLLKSSILFILGPRDVVASAAKGAREYKVLPAGWTQSIVVQERYLKKAKNV